MSRAHVIFGFHSVASRIRFDASSVAEVYVEVHRRDRRMQDFIALVEGFGVRVMAVDAARLDGMVGHHRHQGVAARAEFIAAPQTVAEILDVMVGPALLLVLDGVTDPHNLGACLRVADGAGAQAVIAPKDRACGLNATAAKVASGAADTVPYVTVTNLARSLRELKEGAIRVIGAADSANRSIYRCDLSGPVALVLGAEGEGMRRLTRECCDELVSIPMAGAVESLNVSVAAAVCLFEAARQRNGARPEAKPLTT
jgi:23S rRNA (guanosine2251-2'-O)-methyltransferase